MSFGVHASSQRPVLDSVAVLAGTERKSTRLQAEACMIRSANCLSQDFGPTGCMYPDLEEKVPYVIVNLDRNSK